MFEIELIICMKMDFALNKLQGLICHKNQPTNQPKELTVNKIHCANNFIFEKTQQSVTLI